MKISDKLATELQLMRARHKAEAKPLVKAIHTARERERRQGESRMAGYLEAIAKGDLYTDDPELLALGAKPRSQLP